MGSEAQKAACRRYYERNKHKFRTVALRLNRTTEADVLEKLDSVPSKAQYIIGLIRKDSK